MKFRIPGFSFWALLTATVLFVLCWKMLMMPTPLLIATTITWYLAGYGVAYSVRRFHYPTFEYHSIVGHEDHPFGIAPAGMVTVSFTNQHRSIFVKPGTNLRKAAKAQGVDMYYDVDKILNCQGFGFCGTCRYAPDPKAKEAISDPTWQEKFTLGDNVGRFRLACQTTVLADCTIDNTAAKELGEIHHYSVINGVLFGAFSLLILAVTLWIGGDMVGLF